MSFYSFDLPEPSDLGTLYLEILKTYLCTRKFLAKVDLVHKWQGRSDEFHPDLEFQSRHYQKHGISGPTKGINVDKKFFKKIWVLVESNAASQLR